jgi:hypothetical protein
MRWNFFTHEVLKSKMTGRSRFLSAFIEAPGVSEEADDCEAMEKGGGT